MHDYGKLIYLDMHKTGSTFVMKFLEHACTLKLVGSKKHSTHVISRDPDAIYFASIRHPTAQYSSLFRYGLERKGRIYKRLKRAGQAHLYEDDASRFNAWLEFMLDPSNAPIIADDFADLVLRRPAMQSLRRTARHLPDILTGGDYYGRNGGYDIGLLSYRYLRLALRRPYRTLAKRRNAPNRLAKLKEASRVHYFVRQETIVDDLKVLSQDIAPAYFDGTRAAQFLSENRLMNKSKKPDVFSTRIDPNVLSMLRSKEKLLFELYEDLSDQTEIKQRGLDHGIAS